MLNFLLITADDLNWDTVGVFGCKIPEITPNIDKLASEGIRFEHAHVAIAVCQPSRSALMTGRYPVRNGSMGFEPIDPDVPTLQESLHAAGYLNGIMSKNVHLTPRGKFCWDYYVTEADLDSGRSPSLYYQKAKEFFEKAKAEKKPFFLMANSNDPHRPFSGSAGEIRKFGKHMPVSKSYKPDEVEIPGFLPDLPGVREELAQYYTSAHRCDDTVGELLRALKDTGFHENTLVMFISDNGISIPFAKTNCYLHSTKTPWIVRWPGRVKPGTVDKEHFIHGIDFMPTILEAAGLKQVEGMDGTSFLPFLLGKSQKNRDKVFTEFHRTAARLDYPMRCVQNAKYGYIFNAWADGERVFKNECQGGLAFKAMKEAAETDKAVAERVKLFLNRVPEELYDLEKDPDALKNLASDPAYKSVLDEMRKTLMEHLKSVNDPVFEHHKAWVETGKLTWKADPNEGKKNTQGKGAKARGAKLQ